MKLIFEKSISGRGQDIFPACDVPEVLPNVELRKTVAHLPEISENEMGRHYTALAKRAHGVNDGFYPLGSCTMKHNPRINEKMASLPGFAKLHPLQPAHTVQGANELIADLVALLQSPAKNVISALQSGQNTIHGVLKTLGDRAE